MHDDRIGCELRGFRALEAAHLQAIAGVADRVLAGDFGETHTLHANAKARRVHHDEHRGQAVVGLADQGADRAVKVHDAGRVAMDSHLVLDGAACHCVACAGLSLGVG